MPRASKRGAAPKTTAIQRSQEVVRVQKKTLIKNPARKMTTYRHKSETGKPIAPGKDDRRHSIKRTRA